MGLVDRVRSRARTRPAKSGFSVPPFWAQDGARVSLANAGITANWEMVGSDYQTFVSQMYKNNGIIFACIAARARVFCQARFLWQTYSQGRPKGGFSWNDTLSLLEEPWLNGTLGEWLHLMELDATLAGNSYATRVDSSGRIGSKATGADSWITRLRPDWMKIMIGSPVEGIKDPYHPSCRPIAYWYMPPQGADILLLPKDVMHYSPLPDPVARFLGMSWLTPVIHEFMADQEMTKHKISFLKNAATPNIAVSISADTDPDDFDHFVTKFREEYEGAGNAYKTLFIGGGADVTPLSVDFKALEFTSAQGRGETRIASAAGVHPAIVGLSEGLQGSSLNQGNFQAARRLFVDGTMRDLWSKAAPSMQTLFPPPAKNKRLTPDVNDIPFLREDQSAEVTMLGEAMSGMRQGVEAGWAPDDVVKCFIDRDLSGLIGNHTGLLSVQLQDRSRNAAIPQPDAPVGENETPGGSPSEPLPLPASDPAAPKPKPPSNVGKPPKSGNGHNGDGVLNDTKPFVPA